MSDLKDTELAKDIEEIIEKNLGQPERINARLNLQLHDCSRQEHFVEFAFDVKEWCLNPYDGIHGGIICSLFDTSMGIGAVALSQYMVSTTDISVSYLRPMNGKRYIFRTEYTHQGRRLYRCMGKAFDAETGALCATAMASFIVTETKVKGLQV